MADFERDEDDVQSKLKSLGEARGREEEAASEVSALEEDLLMEGATDDEIREA